MRTNTENFLKIVQRRRPWEANLWPTFQILTVLEAVFPYFCPYKRDFWHGGSLVLNFTSVGQCVVSVGRKTHFWTTE